MVRRFVLMLVLLVLGAACGQPTAPESEPYIRGKIVQTGGPSGAVLVQASAPAARVESAWVRVNERTHVEHAPNDVLRADGLSVGQTVSVWTTGVEMRSLPVQVIARKIVIE